MPLLAGQLAEVDQDHRDVPAVAQRPVRPERFLEAGARRTCVSLPHREVAEVVEGDRGTDLVAQGTEHDQRVLVVAPGRGVLLLLPRERSEADERASRDILPEGIIQLPRDGHHLPEETTGLLPLPLLPQDLAQIVQRAGDYPPVVQFSADEEGLFERGDCRVVTCLPVSQGACADESPSALGGARMGLRVRQGGAAP
jgi:hypothetical protein